MRSAALMLRHLGYGSASDRIEGAVDDVMREGKVITPDLGGSSKTVDVIEAVLKRI